MSGSSKTGWMTTPNGAAGDLTLHCPVCRTGIDGADPMVQHLVAEHSLGRRRARFLAGKLVSWKQGDLDPALLYKVLSKL